MDLVKIDNDDISWTVINLGEGNLSSATFTRSGKDTWEVSLTLQINKETMYFTGDQASNLAVNILKRVKEIE